MRRNRNLELRLQPSSSSSSSAFSTLPSAAPDSSHHHRHHNPEYMVESGNSSGSSSQQSNQQQMTIFYNGRICVCDVTELQARAIILLARQEMEERMISRKPTTAQALEPMSPSLQPQLHSPTGLSMKRSLQRFLQTRRHRVQATAPHHH
ncbi:protein TIFY 5A-like [Malania oleifera]|uniref:protein TIFY 5A-like n=1 Tax=Malania oleifera TaxID=397392 RepID=UPI0025ADF7DC|nr:protein TIFY 5A-like [Malania oleifera]